MPKTFRVEVKQLNETFKDVEFALQSGELKGKAKALAQRACKSIKSAVLQLKTVDKVNRAKRDKTT